MIDSTVGRDTPRIAMARMIIGIESCASVRRMMPVSIQPPLKPATTPSVQPTTNISATVKNPISSE